MDVLVAICMYLSCICMSVHIAVIGRGTRGQGGLIMYGSSNAVFGNVEIIVLL